jgi:multiple sugar transport system substrate-binding protein
MNTAAMNEVTQKPNAPWLLGVCNDIINNSVNQGVPFRTDFDWSVGCADSMYGVWDGSVTDFQGAAKQAIAYINENQ